MDLLEKYRVTNPRVNYTYKDGLHWPVIGESDSYLRYLPKCNGEYQFDVTEEQLEMLKSTDHVSNNLRFYLGCIEHLPSHHFMNLMAALSLASLYYHPTVPDKLSIKGHGSVATIVCRSAEFNEATLRLHFDSNVPWHVNDPILVLAIKNKLGSLGVSQPCFKLRQLTNHSKAGQITSQLFIDLGQSWRNAPYRYPNAVHDYPREDYMFRNGIDYQVDTCRAIFAEGQAAEGFANILNAGYPEVMASSATEHEHRFCRYLDYYYPMFNFQDCRFSGISL